MLLSLASVDLRRDRKSFLGQLELLFLNAAKFSLDLHQLAGAVDDN